MDDFKHVRVPVDFGASSAGALDVAVDLAGQARRAPCYGATIGECVFHGNPEQAVRVHSPRARRVREGAGRMSATAKPRRPRRTATIDGDAREAEAPLGKATTDAGVHAPARQSRRFEEIARRLVGERGVSPERLVDALTRAQRTLALEAHVSGEQRLARAVQVLAVGASQDALTGVLDPAALVERLRVELLRAVRSGRPFSVVLLDLDRFARVDDTHGPAAGDAVLRRATDAILGVLRPRDVLGRHGGDALVVGLVDADARAARRTAERLRNAVAHSTMAGGVAVTVSVGVAARRADADTVSAIVDRADAAMDTARRRGGDQVFVSTG